MGKEVTRQKVSVSLDIELVTWIEQMMEKDGGSFSFYVNRALKRDHTHTMCVLTPTPGISQP